MTWYVETHQVRSSRSPSSINSSSWFRPGMSPKGVVGLNIAWSTALSCADAILLASVKKAEKDGRKGKSWVENSFSPNLYHFHQPIKEGGGSSGGLWDLPVLSTSVFGLLKNAGQGYMHAVELLPLWQRGDRVKMLWNILSEDFCSVQSDEKSFIMVFISHRILSYWVLWNTVVKGVFRCFTSVKVAVHCKILHYE